jgi:hypothetical protein
MGRKLWPYVLLQACYGFEISAGRSCMAKILQLIETGSSILILPDLEEDLI